MAYLTRRFWPLTAKINVVTTKKERGVFSSYSPYCEHIPPLRRPTSASMTKPKTYEDKMYCWFFWLEAIQDPELTGQILDDLERLPTFTADWGKHHKYGRNIEKSLYPGYGE